MLSNFIYDLMYVLPYVLQLMLSFARIMLMQQIKHNLGSVRKFN